VPVHAGRLLLRVATGGERATTLVAGHELPTRRDGDALVVDLPVLGLFEVVRIRCRWTARQRAPGQAPASAAVDTRDVDATPQVVHEKNPLVVGSDLLARLLYGCDGCAWRHSCPVPLRRRGRHDTCHGNSGHAGGNPKSLDNHGNFPF
jgi:hypothetical protein